MEKKENCNKGRSTQKMTSPHIDNIDNKAISYLKKNKDVVNVINNISKCAKKTFSNSSIKILVKKSVVSSNRNAIYMVIKTKEDNEAMKTKQDVFENKCFYKQIAKTNKSILVHYQNDGEI